MMGLRLAEGLPLTAFPASAHALFDDLCKLGYCEKTTQRLNLTREGRLRLDTIVADLLSEPSFCHESSRADSKIPKKHLGEDIGQRLAICDTA